MDGVVADRPAQRQGLLQVDDVGEGGGDTGRPGAGGGQLSEGLQPDGDQVGVRTVRCAVGDIEVGGLPVAHEHPGLEDAHLHTQLADLEPEAFGQCFERVLRGGVVRQQRRDDATGQRGDVHDLAAPPCSHRRQHRPHDTQRTERVRVELAPELGLAAALDRAVQAVTGVVDHDVDASVALERGGHDAFDFGRVGHIEPHGLDEILEPGCHRRSVTVRVPHGCHHDMTSAGDLACRRRAEAHARRP